jgi:hypothetical protein
MSQAGMAGMQVTAQEILTIGETLDAAQWRLPSAFFGSTSGKVGLVKLISVLLVVVMARVRVVFKVFPTFSPGLGYLPQPRLVDLADGIFR